MSFPWDPNNPRPFTSPALERSRAIASGRLEVSPRPPSPFELEEEERRLSARERAERMLASGLRGLGAGLSPLQLPQDILFSILHGSLDPETSVWDNFKEMEWDKYTPWTDAPRRVVSGRELLRVAGVENERGLQWGGIAADLVADPLLMGGLLRGVAKVTGIASARSAADKIDTLAQSVLLAGAVPTPRVIGAVRGAMQTESGQRVTRAATGAYYTAVPQSARRFIDQRMEDVAQFAFDLQYKPRQLLGGESVAGFFMVDGGRNKDLVRLIRQAQDSAGEPARVVAPIIGRLLQRAGDERASKYLNRLFRAQQPYFREIPERIVSTQMSQATRDALTRATWSTASETGAIGRLSPQQLDELGDVGRSLSEARRLMMGRQELRQARTERLGAQEDLFERQVERLAEIARRNGDDADAVTQVFRANVDDAIKATAVTSYYTSLQPYLREDAISQPLKWLESIKSTSPAFSRLDDVWPLQQQQDWAARIWSDALHEGMMRGQQGLEAWYGTQYALPQGVMRQIAPRATEGPTFRAGDMFKEFEAFSPLKPGEYFKSLMDGHLRRTYGAFQSQESFDKTMAALRQGQLVMKNIVEDAEVLPKMREFNPAVTGIAQDYLNMVTPLTGTSRAQGIVVRQEDLVRHMTNHGVSADDAMAWMRQFVKESNPQVSSLVDDVQRMWGSGVGLPAPRTQIGPASLVDIGPTSYVGGTPGALRPRTIESGPRAQEFMSALGEVMDPAVSLLETAAAAERMVGVQVSLKRIMDFAAQNKNLVREAGEAAPPGWIRVPDSQFEQYANIAGKTVHPIIYREINNLMAVANKPNDFFRGAAMLRSLVTGGYLANPATTTINAIGGFFTAALYGQNPITLAREMLNVHRDLKKFGRKLPDLDEAGFLVGNTLSQNDIYRLTPELAGMRIDTTSNAVRAVKNVADNVYSAYQEYAMRRPAGIGALGLEPFEMIETTFRIAAFRTAKQAGKSTEEALDLARFIVFDYSAQPGAVRLARDTGVFLFPAFPYFMFGRTVNAALNRPGTLGFADRLSEAMWNANVPDENERLALWGAQEEFMRRDRFVPLWSINDREGNPRGRQFMSFNQIIPTNTLTASPFVDQLESVGLLGPLYDLIFNGVLGISKTQGLGRTHTTGQITGQQIFNPSDTTSERVRNVASFAYRSFAPGFARKLYQPTMPGLDEQGLIPALYRTAFKQDDQFGETMYGMNEALARRADRGLAAEVWSGLVRGTRAIVADGPGRNLSRPVESARRSYEISLNDLRRKAERANARGNTAAVAQYQARAQELREEFIRVWGPFIEMARAGTEFYGGQSR